MSQQVGAGRVAWTVSTDQEQTGEEHAVGPETLADLEEVACLEDEQGVRRALEHEMVAVGASTAVPAEVEVVGSARSKGVVEGEGQHFAHAHAQCQHMADQEQEVTQFLEKEHWGKETLLPEAY